VQAKKVQKKKIWQNWGYSLPVSLQLSIGRRREYLELHLG
jgi:hypothetical protein